MLQKSKINNSTTTFDKINSFVPARNLTKPGFGKCSPCCTLRGAVLQCIPAGLSHQLFIRHTTAEAAIHNRFRLQTPQMPPHQAQLQVTPQQHLLSDVLPPQLQTHIPSRSPLSSLLYSPLPCPALDVQQGSPASS